MLTLVLYTCIQCILQRTKQCYTLIYHVNCKSKIVAYIRIPCIIMYTAGAKYAIHLYIMYTERTKQCYKLVYHVYWKSKNAYLCYTLVYHVYCKEQNSGIHSYTMYIVKPKQCYTLVYNVYGKRKIVVNTCMPCIR